MWLALGPSCLSARQASSNSRFSSVAVPSPGALAGKALLQFVPYRGSAQQSYAGTKSQGRLGQALLGSCAIRLYISGA